MNRLDNVLGPEFWRDEYIPLENSFICKLSLRLPNGEWLTKCDAGGGAGMPDQGDDDKSAISDAFKRAAVKWGVSRYLYRDGVPDFAQDDHQGQRSAPRAHGPAQSSPPRSQPSQPQRRAPEPEATPPPRAASSSSTEIGVPMDLCPKSGKHLFAWVKDVEKLYEIALLKYLNNWGKLQEFPARMVDWTGDEITLAYSEAVRKIVERPEPPEGDDKLVKPYRQMLTPSGADRPADIPKLQKELTQIVWDCAGVQTGKDARGEKVLPEDFNGTLDMLETMVPSGQRLEEIRTCQDARLLREYLIAGQSYLNQNTARSA